MRKFFFITKNAGGRLKQLWLHLSTQKRWQCAGLLLLMIASAFAEIISLGALLPFLAALAAPEKLSKHDFFAYLHESFPHVSQDNLLIYLGLAFILAIIFALIIRLILLRVLTRLTFLAGSELSVKIYKRTLYQSYHIHTTRNSSEIISGIATKTNALMFDVLLPTLTIINSFILILCICGALVYINPLVAATSIAVFGTFYAILGKFAYQKLSRNSEIIAKEQITALKLLQEGLGGIRDVILDNRQELYCQIYRTSDEKLRSAQGRNLFIGGSPRYIMEAIGMLMVVAIALYLTLQGGIAEAMPVLGVLALGAQRLLPALQQGYNSWSLIMGSQASQKDILGLLDQEIHSDITSDKKQSLPFNKTIALKNIQFRYDSKMPVVLDIETLLINKGSKVGFVGTTGSGKTTLLDIVMGLLFPTKGGLYIDNTLVNISNCTLWQNQIAHVPQDIYLIDASIAENIALGEKKEEINMERIKEASKAAQLDDYIYDTPEQFNTMVGERGIRLSGGQRQRIGIARALYKGAKVLILDEATSALDNDTERKVMDAIKRLDKSITILIVAHRLSTLDSCDVIFTLKKGKICQS